MSESGKKKRNGGFRLLLVPDDGSVSRGVHVGGRLARVLPGIAVFLALLLLSLGVSWVYLATRSARVAELEERVARMDEQEESIRTLAASLEEAEDRFRQLRKMFDSDTTRAASQLWLPSLEDAGSSSGGGPAGAEGAPTRWPLTERGFITQTLLEGQYGDHQGLDIAVSSNSYIRASGPGEVVEVGEDPVYGRYVIVDHGGGYQSVYGHASETLVEAGQEVRASEVIALSGSTGRSTAPHLHFEILRDGEAVDPLTLVTQP